MKENTEYQFLKINEAIDFDKLLIGITKEKECLSFSSQEKVLDEICKPPKIKSITAGGYEKNPYKWSVEVENFLMAIRILLLQFFLREVEKKIGRKA